MNPFRWLTVGCCFLLTFVSVPRLTQNTDSSQDDSSQPISDSSVTLPPGTVISVRIADEISSKRNHAGDLFTGAVDPSVFVQDDVVIPRGTEAHIQMVDKKKGGHIHGKAEIELQLVSLVLNGEREDVDTDTVKKKKGALSTKAKGEIRPGATGAAEVAASVNPVGAVALGGIAAFKAPKVDLKRGARVPFTLSAPFTFNPPPVTNPSPDDRPRKSKRKKH